jgi:UDP-N-acetylglucosamine 1-carboxyvinyltransferase
MHQLQRQPRVALAAGGDVVLRQGRADHLEVVIEKLREAGAKVTAGEGFIRIVSKGRLKAQSFRTTEYPGFPTDLQAQFMALMTRADGVSVVKEQIFENRFMHAPELTRLGCDIVVRGNEATVTGMARLLGAPVMATDLRASVSLVIAGLMAEGDTIVNRVYHLDRGFERLEPKLAACGAMVRRERGGAVLPPEEDAA